MIWKTDNHLFTATLCQKTGEPCPALAQMATKLTQAISASKSVTEDTFEIDGKCELGHCAAGCDASFRADHTRIRIFCGVDADADVERLNRIADALLNPTATAFPSGWVKTMPCALLEALPVQRRTSEAPHHAAL